MQDHQNGEVIGGLHIWIIETLNTWNGQQTQKNRSLGIDFLGKEWGALFFKVLECPEEPDDYSKEIYEQYKMQFQATIPQYPYLARIWDIYIDIYYKPEEIKDMLGECIQIKSQSANVLAEQGLTKLIKACEIALRENSGLLLLSD